MTNFNPHDLDRHDDDGAALSAEYGREVLFEVILMGNAAKVTAVDAETGVEVSIIGPANATSYTLKMNAMRKLMNALSRGGGDAGDSGGPRRPRKPGIYA